METVKFAVWEMSPDACTEFGTDGSHELQVSFTLCSLHSYPRPDRGAGVDLHFSQLLTSLWGQTGLALVFGGYQDQGL